MSTNQIAYRNRLRDLAFHAQIHGEIFRSIAAGVAFVVAEVAVQREAIDILVALFQHLAIPFEISGHERTARAAGDKLERRIDITHLLAASAAFRPYSVADI